MCRSGYPAIINMPRIISVPPAADRFGLGAKTRRSGTSTTRCSYTMQLSLAFRPMTYEERTSNDAFTSM